MRDGRRREFEDELPARRIPAFELLERVADLAAEDDRAFVGLHDDEVGIEIADRRPKRLDLEMQLHADLAVTLACSAECPYVAADVEEWDIPDPAGVRSTRSERFAT